MYLLNQMNEWALNQSTRPWQNGSSPNSKLKLNSKMTDALPTQLAAKLWQMRTDSSVGDNPWETGGAGIKEYVTASDLRHWIRRQESAIGKTYARKLVSRVIDAMLDLSTHRVAVRKRSQRKNGLEYTERWLVLPEDVEVPGEPGGE